MSRPVIVDPAAATRRLLRFAALICALVGLGGIAGAITGGSLATFLLVGVFFLLFAVFLAIGSSRARTGERLVFDEHGISGSGGERDWSIGWAQLRTARTTTARVSTGSGTALGVPCLELTPSDVDSATEYPDLAHLWDAEAGVWRCPVSPAGNALRRTARGIRRFRRR
ncbi:hypothetical protein [Sciscionella sediminilitoris]|uniref:hypothetical protein n=1 Tax=Sciscionella sediminilitoris TaxID=1445613 RepID=UPI0004DF4860|nr:hypothetical protein [Sciscionella sp. SE31]